MNSKRKMISWEPEHRDFSLNKRSNNEFEREQRAESHPRLRDIDFPRFSIEKKPIQYVKYLDEHKKSFSPVPSHLVDSQKIIRLNSIREMYPKMSHRSIIGGMESTHEMRANMSNLDVLGPKNENYMDQNIRQHDNNPLNNSCSDLENDIFKTKTLPENDCKSGVFTTKFSQYKPEDNSYHHNFDIDSGLSELAPIKPPNAYKQIRSINYSNYNENISARDQNRSSIPKNQNFKFEDDLSFGNSNHKNFFEQRRRMTPKEIFDMKKRSGSRESSRKLKIPWNRITNIPNRKFESMNRHSNLPNQNTISERIIINQGNHFGMKNKQIHQYGYVPRTMSQTKQKRNMFHSSEKSISINDEVIKNRFKVQASMAQFNNHPPLGSQEKRREFYPYESTEQSKFKKVKLTSKSSNPEIIQTQYINEKKINQNQKFGKEEIRKKNEDERIENNMMESIGMIELGQFKRYRKLLAFLISLFVTGNVQSEGVDLFQEELQILKIIIYRKFKKHIDIR